MKGTLRYQVEGQTVEREIKYIPVRFILAIALAVMETITVIAIVIAFSYYIPYFYLMVLATEVACIIRIIASEDNPDYKIPWLLLVLVVPVAGFMEYFIIEEGEFWNSILDILREKAASGVAVKLVYDDIGCWMPGWRFMSMNRALSMRRYIWQMTNMPW